MIHMKKCIIFDMDGVLINTEPLHFEIWKKVFAEYGIENVSYDCYKGCIGSTYEYLLGLIKDGYGIDLRGREEVVRRFKEVKAEYIDEYGIPPIPDVPEVVRYLHEKGYKLAVASSSPQECIEQFMKMMGIDDCFSLLFSGENVKNPKPAPDVFLYTAEKLGVDPSECIVVEDSTNGRRAAKAAGMYCIGFDNPDSGVQSLADADVVCWPFIKLKEIL